MSPLIKTFFGLSLVFSLVACNQNTEPNLTINKSGGGSSPIQKPDAVAMQKALNDDVLLQLDSSTPSELASITASSVVFKVQFKINNKYSVGRWITPLTLKIGETSDVIKMPPEFDLRDSALALSVIAKRVKKNDDKNDLGNLVLRYQLDRQDRNEALKTSYLVVLLDLNVAKGTKLKFKNEVIYPVTDFNLDKWIEKQRFTN